MQALSPTGLADSDLPDGFESASPSTSLSDKSRPSQSRISHISDACSLAVLAIAITDIYGSANLPDSLHRKPAGGDRVAVDRLELGRGPLNGGPSESGRSALRSRKRPRAPTAVAITGGSRGLPLTRPAALPPHPALGRASPRGGGGCCEHRVYRTCRPERTKLGRLSAIQD